MHPTEHQDILANPSPIEGTIPPPLAAPMQPVALHERLASLDVMRGFALLGILMVNMTLFAMPFAEMMAPSAIKSGSFSDLAAWAVVKVIFEFKFISLFSVLFGAGLILQMMRADQRGAKFVPLYLRRLTVLAIIGLLHGVLLWYGDILFVYAVLGAILLLCRSLKPRTMTIIATAILLAFAACQMGIGALGLVFEASFDQAIAQDTERTKAAVREAVAPAQSVEGTSADVIGAPAATEPTTRADEPPLDNLGPATIEGTAAGEGEVSGIAAWNPALAVMIDAGFDLTGEKWTNAETQAYRDGPFLAAFTFRVVSFGISLIAAAFGYGWHALALFFLGAAFMKWGIFGPQSARLHAWFIVIGVLIGLPLEILATRLTYLGVVEDRWQMLTIAGGLHELGSTFMFLGWVGLLCRWTWSNCLPRLKAAVANVGRMALTNYLLQTVLCTVIMYWWGLGWFGECSRVQLIGLVVLVYTGQLVWSSAWLHVFSMGPMEWLWRTLTYLRWQPLVRHNALRES